MNNDRRTYIISRLLSLKKEQEELQRELAEISMEESGQTEYSSGGKQFLVENSVTKVV